MANIKYEINGKADTKPIDRIKASLDKLKAKVDAVNNAIGFVAGITAVQKFGEAVGKSLEKYDEFKKSLGEKISNPFEKLQTTLAGTVGIIRDELFNIEGPNQLIAMIQEAIPKIGSALIAAMKVVETIINNVITNFDQIIKPETWNKFFEHAASAAKSFCVFLVNLLKDVFSHAVESFKWGIMNMNLGKILWNAVRDMLGLLGEALERLNKINPFKGMDKRFDDVEALPQFTMSEETKKALSDLSSELGKAGISLASALAGTDAQAAFKQSYDAALARITETIEAMKNAGADGADAEEEAADALKKLLEEVKKVNQNMLNKAVSGAKQGFSNASSHINGVLGNATGAAADKVRAKMDALTSQFNETSGIIDQLFESLKNATTLEEIDNLVQQISDKVTQINGLTNSMQNMEGAAMKAKAASDILNAALSAMGELGQVIQAVMSSNWIGLIIMLIGKLADLFGKLSSKAGAAKNILTMLVDVIGSFLEEMGPVLDQIFEPLLDIFAALGRVIGVLLKVILPVVAMVTQLVNALLPLDDILNTIALAFALLMDGLGHINNAISEIVEAITFGLIKIDRMATDNADRVRNSIENGVDYDKYDDSNSNNSTSYTSTGDLYIYINYSHSYVNGDSRQIAINLRDEIRLAEKAGY